MLGKPKMSSSTEYKIVGGNEPVRVYILGGERFPLCTKRNNVITDGRPRELELIPISVYGPLVTRIQALYVEYKERVKKVVCVFLLPLFLFQLVTIFWGDALFAYPEAASAIVTGCYVYLILYFILLYVTIRNYVRSTMNPGVEEIVEDSKTDLEQCGYTVDYVSYTGCCPACYLLFVPLPDRV
jgi:hypothetical protein